MDGQDLTLDLCVRLRATAEFEAVKAPVHFEVVGAHTVPPAPAPAAAPAPAEGAGAGAGASGDGSKKRPRGEDVEDDDVVLCDEDEVEAPASKRTNVEA